MKKLSPDAMAILDAARDVDNPTAEDRARVKRAVLTGVAASATAVVSATAASKAAASAAGTGAASSVAAGAGTAAASGAAAAGITGLGAVTAKALVTLSLVGASVGVAVSRPWEPTSEDVVAVAAMEQHSFEAEAEAEAEAVAIAEATEAEAEAVAEVEAEAVTEAETVEATGRREPARIAVPNTAHVDTPDLEPDTIVAELALLRRANVALSRGDHGEALAALDEHAANFPRGAMIAERNGTRALVLCASAAPGARNAAQRFLETHPRSPIAQRIRDNCLE